VSTAKSLFIHRESDD
jgi:chromosome segregation ATPase